MVNTDIEQFVLGSILCDTSLVPDAVTWLDPNSFVSPVGKKIFEALKSLTDKGKPVDMLTLTSAYAYLHKVSYKDAAVIITPLVTNIGSTAHFKEHCMMLIENQLKREMVKAGSDIMQMDAEADVFDMLATNKAIYEDVIEVIDRFRTKSILEVIKQSEKPVQQIKTGFYDLDKRTGGGWEMGDYVIIGGRASMGKTAFALNLLLHNGGVFISLETVAVKILRRLQAIYLQVPLQDIKTGKVSKERINKANQFIRDKGIIIEDKIRGITDIENRIRRLSATHKYFYIDYLQLIKSKGKNREDEVSKVSRGIQEVTKDREIITFALSQLNRGTETRHDKKPRLVDLRDSGQIEQDADHVVLMYRPAYYDETVDVTVFGETLQVRDDLILSVAKTKEAEPGDIVVRWDGASMKIRDYTDESITNVLPF